MKNSNYVIASQSIRLPSKRLIPSRMIADGEELDSLEQLASYLASKCISCLLNLIIDENPLAERNFTSVVWLRRTGEIEVVYETNYRDRSLGDLVEESLFVDAFRSERDVVPFSRFHRWIADEAGPYVGDMIGRRHCIKPSWHRPIGPSPEAYQAVLNSIKLTRLRVERLSQWEAMAVVKKHAYRERLKSNILHWLISGSFADTLELLSLVGLKSAALNHGADFVSRWGRDRYFNVLKAKTQRAIALTMVEDGPEVFFSSLEVSHLTSNATLPTSFKS